MKIDWTKVAKFMVDLDKNVSTELAGRKDLRWKNDDMCDGIGKEILYLLFRQVEKFEVRLSSTQIAGLCNTSRSRVRKRILLLAQFGIIKVISEWKNDGSKCRKPWLIQLNPVVSKIVLGGRDILSKERSAVIKHLVNLGIERLYIDDENVQGFEFDTPFGQKEPTEGVPIDPLEMLEQLVADSDAQTAKKTEDRNHWRKMDEAFVEGAAGIWMKAQSALGRGVSQPNWYGEIGELAPEAKRERANLVKTFRQYGGSSAAIAWTLFCGFTPEMDDKGQVKYIHDLGHRQYPSPDKKPAHFVKHFNAIIKDPKFKRYTTKEWAFTRDSLRKVFKASFDQWPCDGEMPSQKIGYEFGSTGTSLEDIADV